MAIMHRTLRFLWQDWGDFVRSAHNLPFWLRLQAPKLAIGLTSCAQQTIYARCFPRSQKLDGQTGL